MIWYRTLLLFRCEKFSLFSRITLSPQKVFPWILLSRVPKIGSVTGNRESFSGNERKDVKPWNFFTAKQKQYTVFLNLSCNFTVDNCIILFQVTKKPVMIRVLLYSHIYLSCTVGLTSEASTQSQLCNIWGRKDPWFIQCCKIDTFILIWFLKNVGCLCYNDVTPCAHYTSLCRRAHYLHILFIDLSSFCAIIQCLSNIYRGFETKFRRGSQTILENGSSTQLFHPFKVGNWLRLSPNSFVSAWQLVLFQKSSERISVFYQGCFSRDLEAFQGK